MIAEDAPPHDDTLVEADKLKAEEGEEKEKPKKCIIFTI